MKKQRRTNSRKAFDIAVKGFLPLLLIALLFVNGGLSAERLLNLSAVMTSPFDTARHLRERNNKESRNVIIKDETPRKNAEDSVTVSSYAVSDIPPDILKLINEAEVKYKNSPNDGKIIEADYSTKNATAEFNGIYLRNTTKSHPVNIEEYLNKKVYADITADKPSVLVYHTHTTETYELLDRGFYTKERSSRSGNSAENMVRVGEEICKTLEKNGIKTIHDKTVYDEQYGGAYDRSRENVSKILKENPSIQIVIDVHRDAVYQKDGSRVKTVTEINGRKAAQIMIISGCEDGNVTDFPNWEKNLTFALSLQQRLSKDNATLMRPLMLTGRKYNMDLMACAVSAEFGTDANTLSEAVYAAELFGESLSKLLKEYK